MTVNKYCIVCNSSKIAILKKFKNFPVTGFFYKKPVILKKNLNLLICKICNHIFHLDGKNNFYKEKYINRPAKNFLAPQALTFFSNFLIKNLNNGKKNSLLEVGAGDSTLFYLLKNKVKNYYIIDPTVKNHSEKKLRCFKQKFEDFNLEQINIKTINAVILSHVIEHVNNPYKFIKKIVDSTSDDVKIFIEIPRTELMIKNLRFDQIFFQHISYFTDSSIKTIFQNLNLKIISKKINYRHWGGTNLYCLEKRKNSFKINYKNNLKKKFLKSFENFEKKIKLLKSRLNRMNNIVGWGAGQNVSIMAYFLKSDYSFLMNIYDDNKNKNNLYSINTKVKIKNFASNKDNKDKTFLITALDNSKIIFRKLLKIGVGPTKIINIKKILNPKNHY